MCITGDSRKVTIKSEVQSSSSSLSSLRLINLKAELLTLPTNYFNLRLRAIRSVWLRMRKSLSRIPVKRST